MTYTTAQVNGWYQAVQFRDGPTASVNSYVSLLNSGGLTPAQVQTAVINDTYTFANANSVIRIYQGAFNRVPDAAGQNYWTDVMGATPDAQKPAQLQTIATQFSNSTEFLAVYGVNGSAPINGAVLTAFYSNILQRAPDSAGYAYWLNSGQNVAQVLNAFSQSNEFVLSSGTPTVNFQQAQINGTAATSGPLWQYGGGSGTTVNYDLTTNVDTINNTKDSINVNGTVLGDGGGNTTFTPGDSITGGQANTNVLNLSVSGSRGGANATTTSSSQTLNNVQTVKITNFATNSAAGLLGNSIFDASLWTGVNAVQLFASTTSGAANSNGNTSVTNLRNIVDATMSNGAANLTLGYQSSAIVGTADTQKLTISNQTGGTFGTGGIESLNLVAGTTESTGVTVDMSDDNLATVTVTGAGKAGVIFADSSIKTFDASAATGNLALDISAAVASQNVTYKGGSGNDAVSIGGTWTQNDSIDGGTGTNTVNITGSTGANNGSGIKNFSTLRVTKVGTGVLAAITADVQNFTATTLNTLEAAVKTAGNNDATLNFTGVNNGSTLRIVDADRQGAGGQGSIVTATLRTNTSADTLTIESLGQKTKTIEANQIETVKFVSSANADNTSTTNDIATVNLTSATSVTASGSAALTVGSFNQKASTSSGTSSTFDASALTGKANITFGSAGNQIIKGGTASDTITLVSGTLNADDTIDLGGGSNTLIDGGITGDLSVLAISNAQTMNLTTAGSTSFDLRSNTALSNLNITAGNGAHVISATNLASGSTVGLTANGGAHAANVTLGWASGATGGTISFDAPATVTDTWSSIIVQGTPTLNIITDPTPDPVVITSLTGTSALKTIAVSGIGSLALNGSSTTSSVTVIDASAASGAFTLSSTFGRASSATITGGNGNDTIGLNINTQGGNTIDAGAGTNKLVFAGDGNIAASVVDLSSSTDQIVSLNGGSNAAIQKGFTNFDASALSSVSGFFGVSVTAASGGSEIVGSNNADSLTGGAGNDTLVGNGGNDVIAGGTGNETITGGAGGDAINVGTGTDTSLYTEAGQSYTGAVTLGTTNISSGLDIYNGLNAADVIKFLASATNTDYTTTATDTTTANGIYTTINTSAQADNSVTLVRGNYSTATGIFTAAGGGTDTFFSIDTNGTVTASTYVSAVLQGSVLTTGTVSLANVSDVLLTF